MILNTPEKPKRRLQVLGVVGARSGSKGVPHKNIRPFAGIPLMAWIINAARQSHLTSRVIVSTDSEEYAEIARHYGAEAPFLRPAELAADTSMDLEYLVHALDWLEQHERYRPDIVLRLLPTSPLQQPEDIDGCIQALVNDPDADSAVVIAEARQHPEKALKLKDDGHGGHYLITYVGESSRAVTPIARQQYPKAYFRANVIASRIGTIREQQSLTGEHVRYHIIPQERALDIDSPSDFFIAEQLLKRLNLPQPDSGRPN